MDLALVSDAAKALDQLASAAKRAEIAIDRLNQQKLTLSAESIEAWPLGSAEPTRIRGKAE